MRRVVARVALLLCAALSLVGCCVIPSFWNSSSNRSYDLNLGKIGTGEQVITSPNEGTPWQGDAVEQKFGR
jgi:hypothetical protein